ncbi:NAD(P)H-dependent oxidoreductase [Acinetobacter pittii]|uniref:NAD(P)H-dependent oxidoreductase n=1 Tax=Acinetobacter pittii TaxID=48296 RepID=UPI001B6FDF00|nr:NAD(P)H-dependent oxidoreductase [Acinetobacter pittii]MCU4444793.1 NAD(P)H-dependent oxidoreductase [Acinetobacter pittii]
MKKTLVIVTHPHIDQSVVNKRWVEELEKHPDQFTVHQIYQAYPDGVIDVAKEQALVEEYENLVFQFPVYWFNCPPLLKQWLDEVLTYGWAYGSTGDKLKNKKFMLAVSAGVKEKVYSEYGGYNLSLEQIFTPFKLTALYVGADYQPLHAFYGIDTNPSEDDDVPTQQDIADNAAQYVQKLFALSE